MRIRSSVLPIFDVGLTMIVAGIISAAAVGVGVIVATIFIATSARGVERFPGQYAQVDPAIRQWFRDQKVPGTQRSCCSETDGVYAEEDIRDGHYWTRFVARQYNDGAAVNEIQSDWMQVPDEAIIKTPNLHGRAVVWWSWQNGLTILCYSPGPLT